MYKRKPLNYQLGSLEPFISKRTIDVHYNRHYLSYLRNLNRLLIENNFDFSYPKEKIYHHINDFKDTTKEDILFNLGGVVNHELYFDNFSPTATQEIKEPLKSAIIKDFSSIEKFYRELSRLASTLKGSGYTFLALDKRGDLHLINLANQESPYFLEWIPIMAIDVWEHAYYLDQLNERGNYIDNIFYILDFDKINRKYQDSLLSLKHKES